MAVLSCTLGTSLCQKSGVYFPVMWTGCTPFCPPCLILWMDSEKRARCLHALLSPVRFRSCLNIHASHIANVCMLSISLNVVLSGFHDLFTRLNPPRTSIFNRGGSHVFPWLQNGYGVHAQGAQSRNAYFSYLQPLLHVKHRWSPTWDHQTGQVTRMILIC